MQLESLLNLQRNLRSMSRLEPIESMDWNGLMQEKYSYVLGCEIAKPFITESPFNKMDKEKLVEGFKCKVSDSEYG